MTQTAKATTIRINDEYTRRVIDWAASLLNETRTAFLLNSARKEAERVIEERQAKEEELFDTWTVSPEAYVDILETCKNPPPPSEAMKQLMAEYKAAGIKEDYSGDFLST
jgi:uncharacterized protein (DUF1778 family)